MKREKVVVNPVPFYDMIDEETGYITLTRFNNKASSEVKKAFKALKKKGMTFFLSHAVQSAEAKKDKVLVKAKDKKGEIKRTREKEKEKDRQQN